MKVCEFEEGREHYDTTEVLPCVFLGRKVRLQGGGQGLRVLWWECGPLPGDCVSSVKQEARASTTEERGSVGDL